MRDQGRILKLIRLYFSHISLTEARTSMNKALLDRATLALSNGIDYVYVNKLVLKLWSFIKVFFRLF